ncbi:Uncharacterised protein [Morganella morganii]|nr:Uncharacterised protein [Morganella morganii]
MSDKKYKCHDCGKETKILPTTDMYGNDCFFVSCSHCFYEAGSFRDVSEAEEFYQG